MYIKNFITLLRRYSTSSTLNIVGMAIGFAAIYLIMVQVRHDLSFNRVIPNSDRIYRMDDGKLELCHKPSAREALERDMSI